MESSLRFISRLALAAGVVTGVPCYGLTINLDFSADQAAMNFFNSRPVAKAAVNAAAADLSALLSPTHLTAISPTGTPNVNSISGVNGSTTVTANWDFDYMHPVTGATTAVASPTIAADTVTIFIGMSGLGAGMLGEGAPGGGNVSINGSGIASQLVGATANMQSASNAYIGRGAGPTISTLSSSITIGATTAPFTLTLGPTLGSLSFNNDTNGDSATDTLTTLDNFWHYDSTTAVAAGKNDLYSVALHELLHTIGYGASDTWTAKSSGTTWLGTNGIAANGGTGSNLLDPDGAHVRVGYISTNIYTGAAQEAVMDPSLTTGTRKKLTAIDVALLKDLGFSVAPVPEPGSFVLLLGVSLVAVARRRR